MVNGDDAAEPLPLPPPPNCEVEKGSEPARVFVGSTSIFRSSIGIVRSGGAPPMFEVVSRVISILFTEVLPVAFEDSGVDAVDGDLPT